MLALVSQLASGAAVRGDRGARPGGALRADADDEGRGAASAFRHQGLVLVVEGADPAQLDAVVTAWITALGPG